VAPVGQLLRLRSRKLRGVERLAPGLESGLGRRRTFVSGDARSGQGREDRRADPRASSDSRCASRQAPDGARKFALVLAGTERFESIA
jgi:hypothetical protein